MPLSNAEKCKNYRDRKKNANKVTKGSVRKTDAERARIYRLRKKMLAQGHQLSTNEVLYTPSNSTLQMTFGPSSLPVFTGMSDSSVFIKVEKLDEIESSSEPDINQEADSDFYCDGLTHVKQEGKALDTDSAPAEIKHEEGSLFCCGGLIPQQEGETYVPDDDELIHVKEEQEEMIILDDGGMSLVKEEEEMIIPDNVSTVGIKQEEGSLFSCGDQDSLEKLQEIEECDLNTKINSDSKRISNASLERCSKTAALKKHQCPHCKYKAAYPSKLKIHIIACHTGEKPHHCPSCDYKATTSSILKRHMKAIHPVEKPNQCPHCDFTTADSISLEKHINARTSKEPHQCPSSEDGTMQSDDIEIAHRNEENHLQCPDCEYKAPYPSKLKMHTMACHTGEKPHQCPDCNYKAVKPSNLKLHIMAHHRDEKPHPCPHCDYKTVTYSTLKTHIKYRHTGEKPHQCSDCDYKSVTISSLKKHIMARHLGERPHKCPHCDYRATQNSNLKTHIKYLHMYINE